MKDEGRFDWSAIFRAVAVIVAITAVIGFVVPVIGAIIDGDGPMDTGNISGHEIYIWGFWIVAWALVVVQGSWMLKNVHDRIIDDMLATSMIAAVGLIIVRVIISLIYAPRNNWLPDPVANDYVSILTGIDAGAALMLIVVGLVAARVNKY